LHNFWNAVLEQVTGLSWVHISGAFTDLYKLPDAVPPIHAE